MVWHDDFIQKLISHSTVCLVFVSRITIFAQNGISFIAKCCCARHSLRAGSFAKNFVTLPEHVMKNGKWTSGWGERCIVEVAGKKLKFHHLKKPSLTSACWHLRVITAIKLAFMLPIQWWAGTVEKGDEEEEMRKRHKVELTSISRWHEKRDHLTDVPLTKIKALFLIILNLFVISGKLIRMITKGKRRRRCRATPRKKKRRKANILCYIVESSRLGKRDYNKSSRHISFPSSSPSPQCPWQLLQI